MDAYEEDQIENGVIQAGKSKGSLKEYQTVIAVGSTVRDIKEGDVVCIDPTRYAVVNHRAKSLSNGDTGDDMVIGYKFKTISLDNKECLMLFDQDITFIIEDSEDINNDVFIIDKPTIIKPN